jgi:bifunctional non-homologous end joining protein LigD
MPSDNNSKDNLEKYVEKRKFNITPEPPAKIERSKGELKFVIQKHQASRLHYDFRLEMDGVMKSWAVPKGPSLNPKDKRLAMMTEDHPMSYRTFEGTIPAGEYGGGDVIVWDEGTYEAEGATSRKDSEKKMLEGLERGDMKFIMHGSKVVGSFALVKMKGRQENAWLLIKHQDEFVSTSSLVENQSSVRSEKSLGDEPHSKIVTGKKGKPSESPVLPMSKIPTKKISTKLKRTEMPRNIMPMLATLTDQPFDNREWLYEVKWDGYRAIAEVEAGKNKKSDATVNLYSRNQKSFTEKYPLVAEALKGLGHTALLDGEIIALDANGQSHFESLQNYANVQKQLQYQVFDLLYLDGVDLRELTLVQRKELLQKLLQNLPTDSIVKYSDHVFTKGTALFEKAVKQGLEGIMAKDVQSRYYVGQRSDSWLKIKTHNRQEAIICGYTAPRSSRKFYGSVILGVYQQGELTYIGHTGTGFDDANLKLMHEKLQKLKQDNSPFAKPPKTNAPATWVKPELVCEIEFTEWTSDGHMRHPSFKGLREDKPAKSVVKETPQVNNKIMTSDQPAKKSSGIARKVETQSKPKPKKQVSSRAAAQESEVELSNLSKVYWPKDKKNPTAFTKGDLIDYYKKISKVMLPYLKDRPESLNRHPGGINGPNFFQKNFTAELPGFVETFKYYSESNDADLRWLVCNNEQTLLYMANLGCIEINPWSSTTKNPEKPDWMVIDLDPDDNHCDQVVEAALTTRKILKKAGVECYAKTSGKTGMHIFIPMGGKYTYEQIKQFGEIIANLVHRELPDFTSVERMPAKRKKKIYIDFLQNRLSQTLAAPYSVRPWPGMTVSTPLQWKEVKKGWDPNDYNTRNIFKRLEKYGDLWKPMLGKGIDLKAAIKKLSKR